MNLPAKNIFEYDETTDDPKREKVAQGFANIKTQDSFKFQTAVTQATVRNVMSSADDDFFMLDNASNNLD